MLRHKNLQDVLRIHTAMELPCRKFRNRWNSLLRERVKDYKAIKKKLEKARLGEENSEYNIEGYILLRSKQTNMRELPSPVKGAGLRSGIEGFRGFESHPSHQTLG